MIKVMMGILGLALLATPLFGFAQGANTTERPVVKQHPGQTNAGKPMADLAVSPKRRYDSYCGQNPDGSEISGVVAGLGFNWDGDDEIPFDFEIENGTKFSEILGYLYGTPEADIMLDALMSSYLTKKPILLYCSGKAVNSIYVGVP